MSSYLCPGGQGRCLPHAPCPAPGTFRSSEPPVSRPIWRQRAQMWFHIFPSITQGGEKTFILLYPVIHQVPRRCIVTKLSVYLRVKAQVGRGKCPIDSDRQAQGNVQQLAAASKKSKIHSASCKPSHVNTGQVSETSHQADSCSFSSYIQNLTSQSHVSHRKPSSCIPVLQIRTSTGTPARLC